MNMLSSDCSPNLLSWSVYFLLHLKGYMLEICIMLATVKV